MSFNIEQIDTFISKEVTIFFSLLFIITNQIVTGDDFICERETINWGPDNIPITWEETTASNKPIISDCLLNNKLLSLRLCDNQTGISIWKPPLEEMESLYCMNYQPSYTDGANCPPDYIESQTHDFCYREITSEDWANLCLITGGSSLSFLDLKSTEQYSILQQLFTSNPHEFNIGLPAKNMHPSKKISSGIDYTKEDLELQWLLPGRYGSVIKFNQNSASIVHSFQNMFPMCLSLNPTESTLDKPFIPTVENCLGPSSVLCVSEKNSALHKFGCSTNGYFRVGYATDNSLCYSIKVFTEPLLITSETETILELSCEGNKIFQMETLESNIIYRQLAFATKLKPHDRCLFGILSLNAIMKLADWTGLTNHHEITFTNWDQTIDARGYLNRGDSFLTVNYDGKWSWEETATCIVCIMDDTPTSTQLILRFNSSDFLLTLTVIGQTYLWKDNRSQMGFLCFAVVEDNYTNVTVVSTTQENVYSLTNVGSGLYWCSGHIYQTIDSAQSEQVYAFGMIFAVYVEYHCDDECGDPGDYTETFKELLDLLIVESAMKMENLEYEHYDTGDTDRDLNLMFHLTVSYNERILDGHQLRSYYVLKKLQHLHINGTQFNILSVQSIEFCFPDTITSSVWAPAKVGEHIELAINCYNFTLTCSRNGSNGAEWEPMSITFTCNNQSDTTLGLIKLHHNFRSSNQIPEVIVNLTTTLRNVKLTGGDVFIVSEIFEKISHFLLSDQILLAHSEMEAIFEIFSSLMTISEYVAVESSKLNSTNSLLASLDEIIIQQTQLSVIHNETSLDGISSITSPLVANFILDPTVGWGGIIFLENETLQNDDFLNYSMRYLHSNQSIVSLLNEENLVVASFVPQSLIEKLKSPIIIFTLFFNDVLFQSSKNYKCSSDGIIISLTILNSDSKLSSAVPFYFKPNISLSKHHNYKSAQFCGYWSFTYGWDSMGCILNENYLQISNTILCECLHLTHFGNLINTDIIFTDVNEKILNLITLAGCILSLAGIAGIFITAWVFRSWRSKSSSKFLLQLSAAIALQMILLIFINNSDDDLLITIAENLYGCIATGALIHYSILVMFFWMLIVAYLQFIRYVIVFNQMTTANFLLKSSLFGWGLPLLPVFILIAINPTSYIPSSNVKFCYPSGYGLTYGLLIPIGVIVIANIFVFIAVIISLIKGSSKSAACKVNSDKNEAMWSQLRLSVFLFFILGMSWIFGFLSIVSQSILFSYLFCLTATTQGFILFFYFVILDPVARNLWKQFLGKICGHKRS